MITVVIEVEVTPNGVGFHLLPIKRKPTKRKADAACADIERHIAGRIHAAMNEIYEDILDSMGQTGGVQGISVHGNSPLVPGLTKRLRK